MVKQNNTNSSKKNKPETLLLKSERDIAMDFASKTYRKFDKMIKSIVLFGSSTKNTSTTTSDIDIIIILDNVSINFDQELIAWYREELGELIKSNPYKKALHINTVKLSTWWEDLIKGDPIIVNILRYGDPLIDFGGFFTPLQVLLKTGKIKSTPEAIYTLLQRAPTHFARANTSLLAVVDGLYWAMVDSAHAAIISAKLSPSSPEHIPKILTENFVKKKLLNKKHVDDYMRLHAIAKDILHSRRYEITGQELDQWFQKSDEFVRQMAKLVNRLIDNY